MEMKVVFCASVTFFSLFGAVFCISSFSFTWGDENRDLWVKSFRLKSCELQKKYIWKWASSEELLGS